MILPDTHLFTKGVATNDGRRSPAVLEYRGNYILKGASAIMIKKVFFSAVILAAVIGVMASQSYAVMYSALKC